MTDKITDERLVEWTDDPEEAECIHGPVRDDCLARIEPGKWGTALYELAVACWESGWDSAVGKTYGMREAEAELIAARARIDVLWNLVDELRDESPCHYDHHGYCQEHCLHDAPCPHSRANAMFAASKEAPDGD